MRKNLIRIKHPQIRGGLQSISGITSVRILAITPALRRMVVYSCQPLVYARQVRIINLKVLKETIGLRLITAFQWAKIRLGL